MVSDNRERFDLSGRVAIVTGAGTGLGRAISLALVSAGCSVVGTGRRREPLDETGELVSDRGGKFSAIPTDATDGDQVKELVAGAVSEFGRLDILVNNAGGGASGWNKPLTELTDRQWRAGIDRNLTTAFICAREALPHLMESGHGRVINIASGWAFRGAVNKHIAYGVAKAGMVQMTRMIAMSYARYGVRSHCVAPGIFPFRADEDARRAIGRAQPAGRVGEPEELAALVAFLCTDAAEFLTGEMISSDGGARVAGLIPAEMVPSPGGLEGAP